jgi:hypothetical protein
MEGEQKNAPELPIGRCFKSKSLGGNRVILGVSRITGERAVRQCSSEGLAIVDEKASVINFARKA